MQHQQRHLQQQQQCCSSSSRISAVAVPRPHRATGCQSHQSSSSSSSSGAASLRSSTHLRALGDNSDARQLANFIAALAPMQEDQQSSMEDIATALDVPLGTVKTMVFKRKGLTSMTGAEVKEKVALVAQVVGVTEEQAKTMVTIQPGLLFDTEKQAETLANAIKVICYDLQAPKDEIVNLILTNQSVLHGRQMHLSVADMAHLAMLREPKGRIVD